MIIIKITISSIVIGLKNSYFPLIHLPVVIGQFIIGLLVIGQFNKPITFKVVVLINQSQPRFNHYRNSVQAPKFMHPLSVF